MSQSNINANYGGTGSSFRIGFTPYGTEPISYGRYKSTSNCGGFVLFGNTEETIADSAVGIALSFLIERTQLTFDNYSSNKAFENLGNVCGNEEVNMKVGLTNSTGIIGYCGEDRCLVIKPYDMDGFFGFYLKGGTEENGRVSLEDYGMLYFCGKNVAPNPSGIPMLDVRISGNTIYTNYASIPDEKVNIMSGEGRSSQYSTSCSGFPDDDNGEKDDIESDCDNCALDVKVACNSEQFTSDINEFPDYAVPDTYINPDNGEEERIPYNGLLHVAKVLSMAFKSLYALKAKQDCIINKRLKEITDKLDKLAEKETVNEITVESNHSAYVGKANYMFTDSE